MFINIIIINDFACENFNSLLHSIYRTTNRCYFAPCALPFVYNQIILMIMMNMFHFAFNGRLNLPPVCAIFSQRANVSSNVEATMILCQLKIGKCNWTVSISTIKYMHYYHIIVKFIRLLITFYVFYFLLFRCSSSNKIENLCSNFLVCQAGVQCLSLCVNTQLDNKTAKTATIECSRHTTNWLKQTATST